MSTTNIPIIQVSFHEPIKYSLEDIQTMDVTPPIEVANAIAVAVQNDIYNPELHRAEIIIPEQFAKRSRYRFRWLMPKGINKRSKSLGLDDEIFINQISNNINDLGSLNLMNKYQKRKVKTLSTKGESRGSLEKLGSRNLKFMSSGKTNPDKRNTQDQTDALQQKSKQSFLKNFRYKSKSESPNQQSVKISPLAVNPTPNNNICAECPPRTNKFINENVNQQLFPIAQRKQVTKLQCPHSEVVTATVNDNRKKINKLPKDVIKETKTIDSLYNNRARSNSGSVFESMSFKHPDPTKLPEHSPDSILSFSKAPLKSAGDDQFWVPHKKKTEGGYFKRLSKNSISKSEQNLVVSESTRIIEDALSPTKLVDMGNETIEAAYRHGVNRVTENGQIILLSKTSTRDVTKYLAEGVHKFKTSESYCAFFQHSTCYDLMPNNSKLVVIDSRLQVGKAFRALILNGVRAAIIWNAEDQRFVGMLTITDFIKILNIYIKKTAGLSSLDFESQTVDKWREITQLVDKPVVFVTPESSLFIALQELKNHHVHRLPIIDIRSGNVLHIITHKRLLKYLFIKKKDLPNADFLQFTVEESEIGTFDKVFTITLNTPIKDVLHMFEVNKISAVPVIDPVSKRLVDIYAKFDCIHLASTGNYKDLNLTIAQALRFRVESFQVQTCLKSDTLGFVMDKIVRKEVHRLVVIDNEIDRKVEGIVSLADLLHYFILRYGDRHSLGSDATCCLPTSSNLELPLSRDEAIQESRHGQRRVSSPDALNTSKSLNIGTPTSTTSGKLSTSSSVGSP